MIKLISVNPNNEEHLSFLYKLLEERSPEVNISHKELPSWEEHVDFVKGDPYHVWFIIADNKERNPKAEESPYYYIGSVYKTHLGDIGIHIKSEYRECGYAKRAIPMLYNIGKRNLANINPINIPSIKLFEGLGFRLIQNTYELEVE